MAEGFYLEHWASPLQDKLKNARRYLRVDICCIFVALKISENKYRKIYSRKILEIIIRGIVALPFQSSATSNQAA